MARSQRIRTGGTVGINVEGLPELSRALKSIDPNLQKELRATNRKVAQEVTEAARGRALGLGSVAAKTAPSLRASAGATSAGVGMGGPGFEFAGGAEFGSLRFKQFQPWRGNGPEAGYFLYPTIRDKADDIVETYDDAMQEIIRKADLD